MDRQLPKREVKKLKTMIWTPLGVLIRMMEHSSESLYPLEKEARVQRALTEIDQTLRILVLKAMA